MSKPQRGSPTETNQDNAQPPNAAPSAPVSPTSSPATSTSEPPPGPPPAGAFQVPVAEDIAGLFVSTPPTDKQPETTKPKRRNANQTARVVTKGVDKFCRATTWPLAAEERSDLERDLAAVLHKHNVPSFKYEEELTLGMTVLEIGAPRAMAALLGGGSDDRSVPGQEGSGQDSPTAQVDLSPTDGESESDRILS